MGRTGEVGGDTDPRLFGIRQWLEQICPGELDRTVEMPRRMRCSMTAQKSPAPSLLSVPLPNSSMMRSDLAVAFRSANLSTSAGELLEPESASSRAHEIC